MINTQGFNPATGEWNDSQTADRRPGASGRRGRDGHTDP
jgi:hypothetical protein